jgi:3-hexulose-6-phosphate synthase
MNLQLALDRLTKEEAFQILEKTKNNIDWIEVGTGVIKEYGIAIVREIKEAYPTKIIVADMKTCDAGKYEAIQAYEAGADITTVMAFSANKTITDTLDLALHYNKRVMIDLLGVTDKKRITELKDLGVNLVSLHFGKDMQQEGNLDINLFSLVQEFPQLDIAIAGGISLQSLPAILQENPYTVIVGGAITNANNCEEVADKMKKVIKEHDEKDN